MEELLRQGSERRQHGASRTLEAEAVGPEGSEVASGVPDGGAQAVARLESVTEEVAASEAGSCSQGPGKGKGKGKGVQPAPPPAPGTPGRLGSNGRGRAPSGAPPPRRAVSSSAIGLAVVAVPGTLAPRKAEVRPKAPMKRLFWNSFILDEGVLAAPRATVWGAIDEDGTDVFDEEELELMFGEQPASKGHQRSAASILAHRQEHSCLRIFDEPRRRQLCVMLARLPPVDVTMAAVTDMDDAQLNGDQVELLLANAPSEEELASLRAAELEVAGEGDGQTPVWDDAEAFALRLGAVRDFLLRLQVWAFENSFDERSEILHAAVHDIRSACATLQGSARIQRLLGLALAVGNYLNAGTARGRADGFSMDALAQMRTVRAMQPGPALTLVDFIVRQLERQRPGDLEPLFAEEGEALAARRAARHKLSDLSVELAGYCTQAEMLVGRTTLAQDDALTVRGQRARARLRELQELRAMFEEAHGEYRSLCDWLHEGAERLRPTDELFGLWEGFLQAVQESLESLQGGRARRRKAAVARPRRPLEQLKRSLNVGEAA